MRRSSLALITALLVVLAACQPAAEEPAADPPAEEEPDDPEGTPEPEEPDEETEPPDEPDGPEPEPEPDEEAEGAESVPVYFVRETVDSGLWVEPEVRQLPEPTLAVARAAMEQLVDGGTSDPNLTTLAPEGTEVRGAEIEGATLVVDLSGHVRDGQGGAEAEDRFAQQLAHTGAQFDTVDDVRLLVEGEEVDELWGHVDWSEPLTPDEDAVTRIIVTQPRWGETVPAGEITATGTSVTFEATVGLRLIGPDGEVVEETFTTAEGEDVGVGGRGDWEHTFETPAEEPGRWAVEVEEPDPSAGEAPRAPLTYQVEFDVEASS